MDIPTKANNFINTIITDKFINSIKKWARYNGEPFYVGDADVFVTNKGTFRKKHVTPKMIFSKRGEPFKVEISKTETETSYTYYDVTEIKNVCVCSDHSVRILVAERPDKNGFKKEKDLDVFVYSIKPGAKRTRYPKHPSFTTLKDMFQKGTFMHFNSLIVKRIDKYILLPFNDSTDRIFNLTGLEGDIEYIECDEPNYL